MELQSKLEEKTDECAMLQNSVESLKKSNTDQSTKIDNFIQRIKDVNTVIFLHFRTDRFGQTAQTQIRLLLEELSDLGFHCLLFHLSRVVRKPTFSFPTWSDTNQAVQLQKMARGLKFRI